MDDPTWLGKRREEEKQKKKEKKQLQNKIEENECCIMAFVQPLARPGHVQSLWVPPRTAWHRPSLPMFIHVKDIRKFGSSLMALRACAVHVRSAGEQEIHVPDSFCDNIAMYTHLRGPVVGLFGRRVSYDSLLSASS